METRKYLNEEKYQSTRKKIIVTGVVVIAIALLIGGLLIAKGFADRNIGAEKEILNSQIVEKKYECDSQNMQDPNWLADNTKCLNEVAAIKSKLTDLNSRESNSTVFFMLGAFIMLAGIMIGGFIMTEAYRRNMLAYEAQAVLPVGKEIAEEIAPTLGNVAKEITKGIKEGLKDEE